MKTGRTIAKQILVRILMRFNPFCKPLIPALFTIYLIAIIFTLLALFNGFLFTFIPEYNEIALSAWGFLLLMNFLESVMESLHEE